MTPLGMADAGCAGRVREITGSSVLRRYLGELGLVPGGQVRVLDGHGGNLCLRTDAGEITLDRITAMSIALCPDEGAPGGTV